MSTDVLFDEDGIQDGDRVDGPPAAFCSGVLPRLFQASQALTLQFVLTLAKVAAVSESLSFSAYAHNALARLPVEEVES